MNPKSFKLMPEDHAAKPMDRISGSAKILPVLVLYNVRLSDSPTYKTLCAAAHYCGSDPTCIAVYDNSAICHVEPGQQKQVFAFHHDPDNGGLAAAYNWALAIALEHDFEWLLLLDQDTELPVQFFGETYRCAALYAPHKHVAAVVPHVSCSGVDISPRIVRVGRTSSVRSELTGVVSRRLTAINSGTLIKTSLLRFLGGFNMAYPLDYLDYWMFDEVYSQGFAVAISSLVVSHDLSVADYSRAVGLTRYQSILSGETLFMGTRRPSFERFLYVFRLALRLIKQIVAYRKPRLAVATGIAIFRFITDRLRPVTQTSNS